MTWRSLGNLFNESNSGLLVKLGTFLSAIGLSVFSTIRYLGLQTYAWDTGVYTQAVYTTLFQGRLFFYTADLPANPSGSLLGVHFSPILLIVAPFFLLYPNPLTLLVIQSVALAIGALPLYKYGVEKLGDRKLSAVISIAYLISPMILGISWYGFHPEAFLVPAVISALYYASKTSWPKYFGCIILALATIETAPIIIALLAFYVGWTYRVQLIQSLRKGAISSPFILIPVLTLVVSILWLGLAMFTIHLFNPINPFYFGSSPLYWTVLGARNIGSIPWRIITSPDSAIKALLFGWPDKLTYLALLFGPLMLISLRAKALSLLTLPWLGLSLLSNYTPFYQVFFQYPSFVAPFIFIGAVEGLANYPRMGRLSGLFKPQIARKTILGISLLTLVVATPLVPWIMGISQPSLPYGVFSSSSHETRLSQVLHLIPPGASILTTSNIFPLVSNRPNAYVIPVSALIPSSSTFNVTLDKWIVNSDYVLLDYNSEPNSTLIGLDRLMVMGRHGLTAELDGILLFRRDYSGTLAYFEQAIMELDWQRLTIQNGTVTPDQLSTHGSTVMTRSGLTMGLSSDTIWLQPGKYTVSFRIRTDPLWYGTLHLGLARQPLRVMTLPIGNNSTGYNYQIPILKERTVSTWFSGAELTPTDDYRSFTFSFTADGFTAFAPQARLEPRAGAAYLDEVRIVQVAS